MHLEPKNLGTIPLPRLFRHERRINLKQNIRKRGAEIRAVDIGMAGRFGGIEVLAFGAVELYALDVGEVGEACGKERGGGAEDAGAFAEGGGFVFF